MNCMKCGRETPAEQVFCDDCLLEMEKYPVKPGTVVFLPRRREAGAPKKVTKRRVLSPEEQLKSLKGRMRILIALLVICLTLITVMAYPTIKYLKEDHFLPGQNYTSVNTASNVSTSESN